MKFSLHVSKFAEKRNIKLKIYVHLKKEKQFKIYSDKNCKKYCFTTTKIT